MTLSTSAVAVCCWSDSRSSLSSRVFSVAITAPGWRNSPARAHNQSQFQSHRFSYVGRFSAPGPRSTAGPFEIAGVATHFGVTALRLNGIRFYLRLYHRVTAVADPML